MDLIAPLPTLLQDRFAVTLLGLCEEAGAQGVRDRLMAPLLALLCRRLYGVMHQVNRILAQMQAGSLSVRRRASGSMRKAVMREPGAPASLRFRYGWAWMIRMAPRAAQFAPQIQTLLDEPEMQAALAASPSLRRAVRPLCRGLAFPTPPVLLNTRKRTPDAADWAGLGVPESNGPTAGAPVIGMAEAGGEDVKDAQASRFTPPPGDVAPGLHAPCFGASRPDVSERSTIPAPPDDRSRAHLPFRLLRLFTR